MSRTLALPLLAAASLAGLLAGCPPPQPPPEEVAFSPKCPEHMENWVAADSGEHGPERYQKISIIAASGPRARLPEVHDCQRLIRGGDGGGREYGPLGVLFASDQLATLFLRQDAGREGTILPAATINSWPTSYPTLSIPRGWSCLYIVRRARDREAHRELQRIPEADVTARERLLAEVLRRHSQSAVDTALIRADLATVWAGTDEPEPAHVYLAFVVPVDPTTDGAVECGAMDVNKLGSFPSLPVHATPLSALTDAQGLANLGRASIARWDGDFGNGGRSQHITLRCGDAWCDVLPRGAEGPVPDLLPASPPSGARTDLRGWYDQQYLAVPDPDGSGRLVPGPTLATYVPAKEIGRLAVPDLATWQVVGYIHLDVASPHYKEKLNLDQGWNTISMRNGPLTAEERPAHECQGASEGSLDNEKHKADPWWIRIESAGGDVAYYCSYRHVHGTTGDPLPGIVRWRWLEDDEKTWQRCPEGCCPIS